MEIDQVPDFYSLLDGYLLTGESQDPISRHLFLGLNNGLSGGIVQIAQQ